MDSADGGVDSEPVDRLPREWQTGARRDVEPLADKPGSVEAWVAGLSALDGMTVEVSGSLPGRRPAGEAGQDAVKEESDRAEKTLRRDG